MRARLIDDAGFANAVPPAKQNRVVRVSNVRKDGQKCLEIDCHVLCLLGGLSALPLSKYTPCGVELQVIKLYCQNSFSYPK